MDRLKIDGKGKNELFLDDLDFESLSQRVNKDKYNTSKTSKK